VCETRKWYVVKHNCVIEVYYHIVIKVNLSDTVVFDYIPFPSIRIVNENEISLSFGLIYFMAYTV